MTYIRSISVLVLTLVIASPIFAHDPGLSSAHVTRTSAGIEIKLTFAWNDLAALIVGSDRSERPTAMQLAELGRTHGEALAEFVRMYSDARLQPNRPPALAPGATATNDVAVSLEWASVPQGVVRVEFPVLAKMPFGHRMMLIVGDSTSPIALLDAQHPMWEMHDSAYPAKVAASLPNEYQPHWTSFVLLGIEHILTGFDHLCFLLALLLAAIGLRDVLKVVTTFTVAHSITLAAAATGIVSLSPQIVEPLIAASIVYIGVENLFLRHAPRHRIALVFGFGLVHGLGFATALAERLPGVKGFAMVLPLLGFNGGVELGQLAVAACMIPLIRLARSHPVFALRLQPAFSAMIAVAGIIWFCQRV